MRLFTINSNKFHDADYYICQKIFYKGEYNISFSCYHYAFMNSETPYMAALNLLQKFKSAYYYKAYNYIINHYNEFGIYMSEFKGLGYELLLILAKSYEAKIVDIDRNVYPNAKYEFMTLDKILKNKKDVPEYIYQQALYSMDKLLKIMKDHEEYVAQFYKRTNKQNANKLRIEYKEIVAKHLEKFKIEKTEYEAKMADSKFILDF